MLSFVLLYNIQALQEVEVIACYSSRAYLLKTPASMLNYSAFKRNYKL